jgi:hypothetical protein
VVLLLLLALQDVPPSGQLTLDNGARITRITTVRARITVTSPGAGGLQMALSSNPGAAPAWMPLSDTSIVTLPEGDGEKVVTLRLRDSTGAESSPVSAVIRLDTTPPVPKIEAPERVVGSDVRVVFDVPDAVAVQFTEDVRTWSAWEPYTSPKRIPLSKGPGKKAVFLRFRDEAGNESVPARILVDAESRVPSTTAARLHSLVVDLRRPKPSSLRLRVWLEGRSLAEMSVTLDGTELQSRAAWKEESSFEIPPAPGPRRLKIVAWDAAGGEHLGEAVFQDSDAAEGEDPAPAGRWTVGLLAGVLMNGIDFEASTALGLRRIEREPMPLARLEGSFTPVSGLAVKGGLEYAAGEDTRVMSFTLEVGTEFSLGGGVEAGLAAGGFVSDIDVDVPDFGDFKIGLGVRISAGIRARLSDHLWLDVAADWRYGRAEFEKEVFEGREDTAVMTGPAFMAGLSWRF